MDRLICGDVGFGKTEVAMRAAFKAVASGYQVAVLVPTTVLAEQALPQLFEAHGRSFPCVSRSSVGLHRGRATTPRKDLEAGKVDILVGTHRIVGKDVNFPNLGLVVIDEEQRFGVGVKEKLKKTVTRKSMC